MAGGQLLKKNLFIYVVGSLIVLGIQTVFMYSTEQADVVDRVLLDKG